MTSPRTVHPGSGPVTIVVPIYDHWSSLERCIAAIIEHVDLSVHRVLLVNDCGPHADTLEGLVQTAIQGHPGIEYHRNERNLGFVGTCNRAVLELDTSGNDVMLLNSDAELSAGALDELVDVLYLAEHHGIVCPRSNQASISSIPYFRRPGDSGKLERSREVFAQISPSLPRYYLAPVSVGFCYLIRRSLVNNHGLFDPIFGRGYNEENDLSMRVNAIGYSSLIANHAFVAHLGSASFTPEVKAELERTNHAILMSRFPFFMDAVYTFIDYGYAATDVFADVIVDSSSPERSILIDIHHLSLVYNGSTRYALAFLRSLAESKLPPGVTVTVAAQPGPIDFFHLDDYGLNVVAYHEVRGIFDVGVAVAPVNHVEQLVHLNSHCARWVVSHFDMIASRSWSLMMGDTLRPLIVEVGLTYASRVIALSEFSLRDVKAFYPQLSDTLDDRGEAVLLGSTRESVAPDAAIDPFDSTLSRGLRATIASGGYLVIVGNFYPHKQVAQALKALEPLGIPIVAFGPLDGISETKNRFIVTSGTLTDEQLRTIIQNSALVIFPSAYEGFGLPIADALDFGVPVVAFDTTVAREVVAAIKGTNAVRFFSQFSDLGAVAAAAAKDPVLHSAAARLKQHVRGLGPFNKRLIEMTLEVLREPIDVVALRERFAVVKRFQRISDSYLGQIGNILGEMQAARHATRAIRESESFRAGNFVMRAVAPLVRLIRRENST